MQIKKKDAEGFRNKISKGDSSIMTADNVPRVTICFEKDSQVIEFIDKIRGNMSRSKAFRLMVQYQAEVGEQYARDILGIKHTS